MPAEQYHLFVKPVNRQAAAILSQPDKSFERQFVQPTAHRTDPLSSYKAGDRALKSGRIRGQMKAVYAALQKHPGCSSAELARIMGVDRHQPARRLSSLAKKGLVKRGKLKYCKISRSYCLSWSAL